MDSHLFVKDTVGDVEAAKYGGPAKAKIPRFKRIGAGRVIGLDEALRIVKGSSSSQVEIATGGRKRARYIDSNARGAFLSRSRKRLKTNRSQASSFDSGKSFVPLSSNEYEREEENVDTYIGYEFAGTNKKGDTSEQSDDDSGSQQSGETSSDESAVSPQIELQKRLKMLDNKVRTDPSDITSWLALVTIQEEVVDLAIRQDGTKASESDKTRSKTQASIAEIQLSVLERALRAHSSNATAIPLTLTKLEVAATTRVWDSSRTEKEWRLAIASHASDWDAFNQLWSSFLNWKMKDGDSFVLKNMLQTYSEALSAFRAAYFREPEVHIKLSMEKTALKIVKQVVDMLLQAGFIEQAHGILQALSELTFCCPDGLEIGTDEVFRESLIHLRDYWDLEEYRIGESDSKGWAASYSRMRKAPVSIKAKVMEGVTSLSFDSFPKLLDDPDPVVRWLTLERARAGIRQFSAKEQDEADWTTGELEVDPFSVVLFSDIEPFLVPIESSQGKILLLDLFLSALGVTRSGSGETTLLSISRLNELGRFWPAHLGETLPNTSWEIIGGEMMQRPKTSALSDPFKIPVKIWPLQCDNMFPIQAAEAEPWFACWERLDKDKAIIAKVYLEQIKGQVTDHHLARLGLSEASQSHKAAKKLAKMLLNEDRDNIVLWRAYARLERNNSNLESARTVYMSLLVANHPAKDLTSVWSEWAELEWEAGELNTSLLILITAAKSSFASSEASALANLGQQTVFPMDTLRTRRNLDQMVSLPNRDHDLVFCAALFRYLSMDADEAFESAMTVFEQASYTEVMGEHLESMAMIHCKFIWRHIHGHTRMKRSRAYIPKHITAVLTKYVLNFPHNTALISLLAAFEMTTKVENVLRGVMEEKMQRIKDTAYEQDWLMYLYCELHMNLHSVNENAVRRLLERALQSKSTSASSVLWQLYLQFEVKLCVRRVADVEQSRERIVADNSMKETLKETLKSDQRQCRVTLLRAKAVFYRAIQHVPYCKELYLTAFAQPLRQVFPLNELLQISQLMQEKDLRLYTDLTAFVTPSVGSASSS